MWCKQSGRQKLDRKRLRGRLAGYCKEPLLPDQHCLWAEWVGAIAQGGKPTVVAAKRCPAVWRLESCPHPQWCTLAPVQIMLLPALPQEE